MFREGGRCGPYLSVARHLGPLVPFRQQLNIDFSLFGIMHIKTTFLDGMLVFVVACVKKDAFLVCLLRVFGISLGLSVLQVYLYTQRKIVEHENRWWLEKKETSLWSGNNKTHFVKIGQPAKQK